MIPKRHTFSLADKIDSKTGQPFGERYAGAFVVRKPSLGDQGRIATLAASLLNQYGAGGDRAGDFWNVAYSALAFFRVAGEQVPPWWDFDTMDDEQDERAVIAAWEEVTRWLRTFRSSGDSPARA